VYRLQVVHHEAVHSALGDSRIKNFHSVYGNQTDWQSVDAFVCLHPAATCELFQPFNRSILIVTTTRYEAGRRSIGDWRRWNDRLARIAADPRNVVAANNQYDVEYMRSVCQCHCRQRIVSFSRGGYNYGMIRFRFDSHSTAIRQRYDHSTTIVTTGLLNCDLNKKISQRDCG